MDGEDNYSHIFFCLPSLPAMRIDPDSISKIGRNGGI